MVTAHSDGRGDTSGLLPMRAPTPSEDQQGFVTFPDLARVQELVDASGVVWHRRGGPMTDKGRRRLLRDQEARVIHSCMGEIVEISSSADCEAFWTAAELKMAHLAYADFSAAEFRSEPRGSLLAIEESC